ncbi:MAG: hypothetical protein A2143_08030 [Gallionellales bacterium RBG_16_57_15]|nr:MAG: hypothetical protein A2143_08030 [Gallionellales bacterium RBG_16_57_15]
MELKKLYDPISPSGEVLDRTTVLNSPAAKKIVADFDALAIATGQPAEAISAPELFTELIKRGHLSELRLRKVVRVDGVPENQKFSPKLIAQGQGEGWLSVAKGNVIIHGEDGDVVFKVLAIPGRYCRHCGEKLTDDTTGSAARKHVAEKHAGKVSPDHENPSGYAMQNYYDCKLEANHG